MRAKCLILILFLCLIVDLSFAQYQNEPIVVEDLNLNWEVYSKKIDAYVPYIEGLNDEATRSIFVDLNQYLDFHLKIVLPGSVSILIDQKLVYQSLDQVTMLYSIDSLRRIYDKSSVRITVFNPEGAFRGLTAYVVDIDPFRGVNASGETAIQNLKPPERNPDFFILSAIFILAATAAVRIFNRNAFEDLFSISKAISFKIRQDTIFSTNIFSTTNLTFHLFYGLVLGISLVNIWLWFPERYAIALPESTAGQILLSFVVSLLLTLLMYAKFPLIWIVSRLFSFHKFSAVQYFDYFRLTLIVTIMVFSISVINNSTAGTFVYDYQTTIAYFLLLMLLLRPVVIFIKSITFFNHRKLHLFSYLCTTEIIPLIILLKVFLK